MINLKLGNIEPLCNVFCQTDLPEKGASYFQLQESKALLHKPVP